MNRLKNEIESFQALLETRRYDEARAIWQKVEPLTPQESRMKEQFIAQTLLCQGHFAEARDRLLQARERWGEHLRILAELCTCHYLLESNVSWKKSVGDLKARYQIHAEKVSLPTFYRASIILAKQLEELGELAEALDIYARITRRYADEPFSPEYLRATAQILRIKCTFQGCIGLGEAYDTLRRLSESESRYNLYIEVQHALALAEIHLIGIDATRKRIERILQRTDLKKSDLQLIAYDCIEAALTCGITPDAIRSSGWFDLLPSPRDHYERSIGLLCDPREPAEGVFQDLLDSSQLIPAAGLLRLFSLRQSGLSPQLSALIERQIALLVDGLESRSRDLWIKRWRDSRQATGAAKTLTLSDPIRKEFLFDGRVYELNRQPALWDFLESLDGKEDLEVDEIVKRLYGHCDGSAGIDRLRKTTQKVNRLLTQVTLLPSPIRMAQGRIRINPGISIRRAS